MADNDVNIKFGATIDDVKSKMDELTGIFGNVIAKFGLLAAAAAGGAAFKSFIDETNTLNSEAMKLSKTLGMTGEDAGTLNTALKSIGSDSDTYTGAFLKFNRQLKANSEGMKDLGVDTDALKDGTKTSNQVFMEAIQIVAQYKPGIDQTQVAMQLFGRSVEDVQKLLRLNSEKIEEAKKKNEELNLVITQEGVEASKKYKLAMEDVGLVMSGLQKTIGEAVIPIFTESAKQLAAIGPTLVEGMRYAVQTFVEIWGTVRETVGVVWETIKEVVASIVGSIDQGFGTEAPGAMEVFKNALRLVESVFIGFRVGVELGGLAITTSFKYMMDWFERFRVVFGTGLDYLKSLFVSFGTVADRVMHLDLAGATSAWQAGVDERARILETGGARLVAIAGKTDADLQNAANKAFAIASRGGSDLDKTLTGDMSLKRGAPQGAPPGGTKTIDHFGKEKDKGAGSALALKRAEHEAELALEREFEKEDAALNDERFKNNLVSLRDYYDEKLTIELEGLRATRQTKEQELAEAKSSAGGAKKEEDRNKFMAQAVKLQGEINVLTAQEAEAVRANTAAREDAERKLSDELAQMRAARAKAGADDEITTDKKLLDQKRAMRQIDAESAFQAERELEQRSYNAAVAALAVKRAAIRGDNELAKKAREAQDAEEEAAERAHQQKMGDIDRAAALDRAKYSIQAQQSIAGSFEGMVKNLLHGTKSIGEAFREFGKSVAGIFTDLIAKKFTEKLFDASGVNKLIDKMVTFVVDGLGKMVASWFAAESTKTAASAAGAASREGIEEAAGEKSILMTAWSAVKNIGAKAWEAAANVYAAIAQIPVVGPFLAPAAAVAAGAVVLGFASRIASSAGGEYRVDEDRLNFVHKNETILPAHFAQGLRNLINGGGPSLAVQGHAIPTALPGNRLGAIQGMTAAPQATAAAAGPRTRSGPNITLPGSTQGEFFMANKRQLAAALASINRDFGGKR